MSAADSIELLTGLDFSAVVCSRSWSCRSPWAVPRPGP
jgi:hypothetical protein